MTFDYKQMLADREAGTKGDWTAFNMTHAEGRAMTPEELGEYVTNSVKKGKPDTFLFISAEKEDGPCDICHVGNGPDGPRNARRIARVPDMEAEIVRLREALREIHLSTDDPEVFEFTFAALKGDDQ